MLSLLACVLLAPSPLSPVKSHSPFDNASKASEAFARQFYYELAEAKFPFGLDVQEFDDTNVLFSDGSCLLFEYSYVHEKLKIKASFVYKNLTLSHSFICRYPLNEDDEEQIKYLVMWHLITAFNPSQNRIQEMGEPFYAYPID